MLELEPDADGVGRARWLAARAKDEKPSWAGAGPLGGAAAGGCMLRITEWSFEEDRDGAEGLGREDELACESTGVMEEEARVRVDMPQSCGLLGSKCGQHRARCQSHLNISSQQEWRLTQVASRAPPGRTR